MSRSSSVIEFAKRYATAGLPVIPIRTDGTDARECKTCWRWPGIRNSGKAWRFLFELRGETRRMHCVRHPEPNDSLAEVRS